MLQSLKLTTDYSYTCTWSSSRSLVFPVSGGIEYSLWSWWQYCNGHFENEDVVWATTNVQNTPMSTGIVVVVMCWWGLRFLMFPSWPIGEHFCFYCEKLQVAPVLPELWRSEQAVSHLLVYRLQIVRKSRLMSETLHLKMMTLLSTYPAQLYFVVVVAFVPCWTGVSFRDHIWLVISLTV